MTSLISVKQAFELGRLADRCGPLKVRPLSGGHLCVGISTVVDRDVTTLVVALDGDGRVAAHRRLRGAGASPC